MEACGDAAGCFGGGRVGHFLAAAAARHSESRWRSAALEEEPDSHFLSADPSVVSFYGTFV